MKAFILGILGLLFTSLENKAVGQYASCPNQGSDVTGHLAWRLRNPATGALYNGAPQPGTIYQLEIYETPYTNTPPNYVHYSAIGIEGFADGFKLYPSVYTAQNNPNNYYSDATIEAGVGPDVGSSNGVAVFGIKTLDATDPNWTGQLTAFKAYGLCYPSLIGYPNQFFKKTLVRLP